MTLLDIFDTFSLNKFNILLFSRSKVLLIKCKQNIVFFNLVKGLTIALLFSQLGSGSQNPQKLVLRHYILIDETCR